MKRKTKMYLLTSLFVGGWIIYKVFQKEFQEFKKDLENIDFT